jgi:HSP20 family protein
LLSRDATSGGASTGDNAGKLEASQQVALGADGEVVPVKFELVPSEVGRKTLRLRVQPLPQDRFAGDDQQEVDIEIVDRKTRVLLFAGGPSREYQFLRNQLRRDKDIVVTADLPGVDKNDIKINVRGEMLEISAERNTGHERTDKGYVRHERRCGRFYRSIRLPVSVETDNAKACFNNGVLEIILPKAAKDETSHIPVS